MNFKYRKRSKSLPTGQYPGRDKQFKLLFSLVALMGLQTPILSIDCKKKEQVGNLYREGKCYAQAPIQVYDHDYAHLSEGKVIPYGIYDIAINEGYISIGTTHETAEFICGNLLWWWDNYGINYYPPCKSILILAHAGGANSYRHHAFRKQLLYLSSLMGKDIILCHYPPYASKWNVIEHRLFAQLHQAMQGVVFTHYAIVKQVMEKTSTDTGLKVVLRINPKNYQIGKKTTKQDVDYTRIQFHPGSDRLADRICA